MAAGKVAYDTTLGDLQGRALPADFTFANEDVADITLLELAIHASGLPRLPGNLVAGDPSDPYKGYGDDELLRGLAAARDEQPLRKRYAYSNFGVGLLGWLLGRIDGGGYHEAVVTRVIEPLGLGETGFQERDNRAEGFRGGQVVPAWSMDDALAGAGALWGSTSDLLTLARTYLDVLAGEADAPLKHALADDLEVIAAGPDGFEVTRVWHVSRAGEAPIYWHNGGTGGYWSFVGFRPDTNEAVAIAVSGDPEPTGLGLGLLGRTLTDEPSEPVDETLFGQYQLGPYFGIGVFEQGGVLLAQASGQPPFAIEPVDAADGEWYALTVTDASVRFVREDGEVVALELAQGGRVQRADKVADVAEHLSRQAIELPRGALEAYVGEYSLGSAAKFTIRLGEEHLEARITGQPFF